MSHISQISVAITDLDALIQAVARYPELKFICGQTNFKSWATEYGRLAGDTAPPQGFTEQDFVTGCAEHVIRVKGNARAYEIGVARRRDGKPGWVLLTDTWQGGYGLEEVVGVGAKNLVQAYNEIATTKAAQQEGWNVQRVSVNGGVELHLTRW